MFQRECLLPATEAILGRTRRKGGASIFIIQHLLDDTAEFVSLLRKHGYRVPCVIGIPYSASPAAQKTLVDAGIDAIVPSFPRIDAVIRRKLAELRAEDRPVIVHEVGGYCADIMRSMSNVIPERCLGFVEETKQGLWRYRKLPNVRYPVMHIAESRLKDIEGPYVGRAVAESLIEDLANERIQPSRCAVGVLGIGIIGSSVAGALAPTFPRLQCWDEKPIARLQAISKGLPLAASRSEILATSDVIVGATGTSSLRTGDLASLRDGVILASASSRRIEMPINHIRRHGKLVAADGYVQTFAMPWRKSIRIVNDGSPINFRRRSLPSAIADLMFAQIATCIEHLLTGKFPPGLHPLPAEDESRIAEVWLKWHQPGMTARSM
jgi:adenosylhomocysteinase